MKQWIRAAACAAVCGTLASAASAQQQRQVVIDAVTGRVRMPDHEELKREPAAAAAAQAAQAAQTASTAAAAASVHSGGVAGASRVAQHLRQQALPATMGAVAMRVPASRLSYSVARRQADGSVDTACVVGDEAARQARAGASNAEHGHAH